MRWPWRRYHMLICSLPALPTRFDAGRLPITPERLQQRLRMLDPDDAREIRSLTEILEWGERFAETSDAEVVRRYRQLMGQLRDPLVRATAAAAVDARMIVTALRQRRRGLGPPQVWIGQWSEHIRRHFADPNFRLAHAYPRLEQLRRLLEEGDALGFHRAMLGATWAWLRKRSDDHHFDFGAVVLYVARWEIIHHWQQLEAERGRAVFETLVTEALGDHADVYA
jgi:hypothetical protein